jgi:glutathione S-transferase
MIMTQSALTLFVDAQYLSPYALTAFVALHEKGLPHRIATLDLAAQAQHQAAYATHSLTQRVPTLQHGDFYLSESTAICEYLDEQFDGAALYPSQPQHKARARQIQAWLRSDLLALRTERSTEVIFYAPNLTPLSPAAQQAVAKLIAAAEQLIPSHGEHLFGDWCLADLDLAIMLNRLVINGDAVPERLAAYATRQWQRESVQAWLALNRSAARAVQ